MGHGVKALGRQMVNCYVPIVSLKSGESILGDRLNLKRKLNKPLPYTVSKSHEAQPSRNPNLTLILVRFGFLLLIYSFEIEKW